MKNKKICGTSHKEGGNTNANRKRKSHLERTCKGWNT